ncbi:hypothetical protein [Cryobacterium sp. TMT2-14]|uniref:hypothetical protein n=1 Tax=Cryobacterium sp. TMT2-14 TaxID=1259245 RepID=UPI001F5476EE|nr:hypothetical protein [Cryobacterium sp. TMT2-14]
MATCSRNANPSSFRALGRDVVLEFTDRPVVLASAGIGVTPMAGMLSHLVKTGSQRKVSFLHADNSANTFALRNQIREDLAKMPDASLITWYVEPTKSTQTIDGELAGFMDVNTIELPTDAEYYLCGPLVFMQSVRSALIARGIPAKDIQYEVFGPDLWLADFQS